MPRVATAAPAPLPADLTEALRRLKLATVRRLALRPSTPTPATQLASADDRDGDP